MEILRYQIINFQLPNDGFVYPFRYAKSSTSTEDVNQEVEEMRLFIRMIVEAVEKVPDFTPAIEIFYRLEARKYHVQYFISLLLQMQSKLERFEFYFDDEQRARMLTVKFEPGAHRSFVHKEKLSLAEWKNRLLSTEEKKRLFAGGAPQEGIKS